jgi:tRNA(Ile)-lysidine synthase
MGGEIVYHNGINKTLKNVLQEAKIPLYRRERTPLLYSNNTILAMPGLFINTKLLSTRSETGYIPIWIPYNGY